MSRQGERGANWKFNLKAVYGIFSWISRWRIPRAISLRWQATWLAHWQRTIFFPRERSRADCPQTAWLFLQLPCFKKEESECENDFERWIYVLKNMETLQRLPFKARKSVFEKLEQIVDIASLSKEERMKYDESIKVYRDQLATLDFAKQKGRAEERLDIRRWRLHLFR